MTSENRLLPLGPAARSLRVPSKWLRDEARAGRVPALNAGGRLLFDLEAVIEALKPRARQTPAGVNHD